MPVDLYEIWHVRSCQDYDSSYYKQLDSYFTLSCLVEQIYPDLFLHDFLPKLVLPLHTDAFCYAYLHVILYTLCN